MTNQNCRLCGHELNQTLVDLGYMAVANSYVKIEDSIKDDPVFPLHTRVCDNCFLVQIGDSMPPHEIFSNYAYFSSYSPSWVAHAKDYADNAKAKLGLNGNSLVVEVASNDGYLLQHFVAQNIPVLGVEPAANIAVFAEEKGVRTEVDFFNEKTAKGIVENIGKADLTIANNVLAHVPDINDFMAGFATILKPEGVSTFEFPHLINLLNFVQFDTIYHEHFTYLSLLSVERCLQRHAMRAFDVEHLTTHGGSLRVWACLKNAAHKESKYLRTLRAVEKDQGLNKIETYQGFTAKVEKVRSDLLAFLKNCNAQGKRIAAYGAAAKGNTLLNYCAITEKDIDFVVDANPHKQNHLLPGSRIPIHEPDYLKKSQPDYILILPWNLKDEITNQIGYTRQWGAKFIVAIPELTIW